MNEPGCVCFLSPNSIQKTTRNPETERKSVACVILGTNLGDRNSGQAIVTISQFLLMGEASGRLACEDNSGEIYKIDLPRCGLKCIIPKGDHAYNRHRAKGDTRAGYYPPTQ